MADIERLMKTMSNRHYRICADLERQRKDILKLTAEIDERGKLIDTLATENDAYKWFICKIPLRQFDEIMDDVPDEYRRIFILTKEEYETLNLPTND